jgi:hypothetical protein
MRIVRGSASLRVDHQCRESVGCSGLHFNNISTNGKARKGRGPTHYAYLRLVVL